MIPARNEICAHAQDFLANNKFLLSILVALGHYTLLEMLDVFRPRAVVKQSGARTCSSLVVVPVASSPPAPHQTLLLQPSTTGVISWSVVRKTVSVPKKQ